MCVVRRVPVRHANNLQAVRFDLLVAEHAHASCLDSAQIFAVVAKLFVIARDKVHALRRRQLAQWSGCSLGINRRSVVQIARDNVEDKALAADDVVGAYKSLARVERAFRSLKTVDLHLRPIHHWLAPRVRAHVFLCMLACHVEWHMRERLKPILFDDDDPAAAARERTSIVAPAQPSPTALRKRASKLTAKGGPVHSFQSLLRDLATCTLNEMTTTLNDAYSFTLVATPTPIQAQAFDLLDVDPTKL